MYTPSPHPEGMIISADTVHLTLSVRGCVRPHRRGLLQQKSHRGHGDLISGRAQRAGLHQPHPARRRTGSPQPDAPEGRLQL